MDRLESEDSMVELANGSVISVTMDVIPIGVSRDVWSVIAWWLEFPQLSKLWATGNRWIQSTMGTAPDLKIVGCCDPLLFQFTKLSVLDLSDDRGFDLTAIKKPLPVTLRSLTLHLSSKPQRPLTITDFPPELRELTIHTETPIEFTALPRTLTSLTVMSEDMPDDFWSPFSTNVVSWLPELQTLILSEIADISSDTLRSLPPSLTRITAPCGTPLPEDLSQIHTGVIELNLEWKIHHIPYLPRHITRLMLYDQHPLAAANIDVLPQSITALSIIYTGDNLACFERLPLRKWTLHLPFLLDFRGNFSKLTHLDIGGAAGAQTVYVPATVKVLDLRHFKDVVFPPELRLRKLYGCAINRVKAITKSQLSICTNCIVNDTTLTSMVATTMKLNPACLTELVMYINSTFSLAEVIKHLLRFTNLKNLCLHSTDSAFRRSPADHASVRCYLEHITLPSTLTKLRLDLDGTYQLPSLELPRSLNNLYLRGVNVISALLRPLHELRFLNMTIPKDDTWSSQEMMAVLDDLPQRMSKICIRDYQSVEDLSTFIDDYRSARVRYLVDFHIVKAWWL